MDIFAGAILSDILTGGIMRKFQHPTMFGTGQQFSVVVFKATLDFIFGPNLTNRTLAWLWLKLNNIYNYYLNYQMFYTGKHFEVCDKINYKNNISSVSFYCQA